MAWHCPRECPHTLHVKSCCIRREVPSPKAPQLHFATCLFELVHREPVTRFLSKHGEATCTGVWMAPGQDGAYQRPPFPFPRESFGKTGLPGAFCVEVLRAVSGAFGSIFEGLFAVIVVPVFVYFRGLGGASVADLWRVCGRFRYMYAGAKAGHARLTSGHTEAQVHFSSLGWCCPFRAWYRFWR